MSRQLTTLVAVALAATAGSAQDVCRLDITPGECLQELSRASIARASANAVQKKINTTPTSVDPFGSEIASTLRDFLPLFDGLVNLDSISEDGRTVNLNLNPAINYKPLQLTAKIRKPVIWEVLEKSLPEDGRDETVGQLDSMLGDYDDLEVAATYRLTRTKSRQAFQYQGVFRSLVSTVPLPSVDELDSFLQEIEDRDRFPDVTEEPILEDYLKAMDDQEWQLFQVLLSDSAESISGYQSTVESVLSDSFDAFAKAVNNQSQLFASLSYRDRDDIAGPDILSLKVTYEIGLSGVKSLQKRLNATPITRPNGLAPEEDQNGLGTLDCPIGRNDQPLGANCPGLDLARAIKSWGETAVDNRISFSLEYSDFSDVNVLLPDLGIDFMAEAQKSLIASAAWGRKLGDKKLSPRIDFQASYEDVSDDPNRRDRAVASLVLSQKVSDNWTLPIGILYANHSRYLTGEDEKVSAHFGIRYKLQQKDPNN